MRNKQSESKYDLLIVGGGINGAGIARDAAGRGLRVLLCEKDDLASHTSSASTKLIHGGLRYLEHYQFRLVRKALIEREILLRSAPHIMRPMRFVMPHDKGQRPAWLIRSGLFLYDHLAPREVLPGSESIDLLRHVAGAPLKKQFTRGFVYSDGWVDDSRLVVLNAVDAAENGAVVLTRTICINARREAGHWVAEMRNSDGSVFAVSAHCLVNAAGPWAAQFERTAMRQPSFQPLRLVKGSHIVVKRLFEHSYAYIFQHPDRRIVFAIPYENEYTLIGTTDVEYKGDADKVVISRDEIDYLCTLVSRYFQKRITADDVVWAYSGVRPLLDDREAAASAVTRDYSLALDTAGAPLLSVWGGKITTFRKLAEEAVNLIALRLGARRGAWTSNACLPGGEVFGPLPVNRSVLEFEQYVRELQHHYQWLPAPAVTRLARTYGTRIHKVLAGCSGIGDMGEEIVPGLHAVEVQYLMQHEWAASAADILWRRTKMGLHLPAGSAATLDNWITENQAHA